MQKGGHGNDGLLILVPVAVLAVVGVVLFGGPKEALEAMNTLVGDIAAAVMAFVSARV
jgi:hypothetical protein